MYGRDFLVSSTSCSSSDSDPWENALNHFASVALWFLTLAGATEAPSWSHIQLPRANFTGLLDRTEDSYQPGHFVGALEPSI